MLRSLTVTVLILILSIGFANARDLFSISEQAMKEAGEYAPDSVQFSDQATKDALKQSRKTLSELNTSHPVLPSMPKLDLMKLPAPSRIDINNLAQQGQQLIGQVDEDESRYDTQVLVFVSSSMPVKVVKRYLQQTSNIGAALVFRGLISDTMKDTQQYLAELLDKAKAEQNPDAIQTDNNPTILIDPTLFDRFSITQVPVTVVTESEIKPCLPDNCPTPVHHTVAGDVSLHWALELVSRQIDSDPLKETLRPLIKHMRSIL